MNDMEIQWLTPDWPVPPHIRAFSTTRLGGFSQQAFCSMNLGDHVGDDTVTVVRNRAALVAKLNLPNEPYWLKQVHRHKIIKVCDGLSAVPEADGSFSRQPEQVCAVLTADCLPILFSDKAGTTVAAIHAGWRGLASGIIDAALEVLGVSYDSLLVWLGPAIGPAKFEVGDDVKAIFATKAYNTAPAFRSKTTNKWLLDIYELARCHLSYYGVKNIYGGDQCTYSQSDQYFSYRRDGLTGRMVSLIWIAANQTKL